MNSNESEEYLPYSVIRRVICLPSLCLQQTAELHHHGGVVAGIVAGDFEDLVIGYSQLGNQKLNEIKRTLPEMLMRLTIL